MLLLSLHILLVAYLSDIVLGDSALLKALSRKKRSFAEYDDNIFMFRNPNVTIPFNRTRLNIHPEWLYFTHTTPRVTYYWGQKGLTKEWTTFAWFNDRVTVYLETFLKGLKKAPYTIYPRYSMPSTTPKTTTLSVFEQMTLYNKKDLIFKFPWAYLPHQNFRKEMGFGPNDTIDINKVDMKTIQAFEDKYKVTVMYQWPNTHPEYLRYINFEKYKHTFVFSGEMSTQTPLNKSLIDFEEWFAPQVPRLKLKKVESLDFQLRVMFEDVFQLGYLDKNIFVKSLNHDQLVERYNRFRNLRKREYRTWYRRKVYIPWKHLVRDGVREWFLARGRCVPSPGQSYFHEINRQFESLSADLNETLYSYFADFEDQFMHFYAATYGPHWNMSLEVEHTVAYTRPTLFSPVTASDEFYLYEKPGVLPLERKRRQIFGPARTEAMHVNRNRPLRRRRREMDESVQDMDKVLKDDTNLNYRWLRSQKLANMDLSDDSNEKYRYEDHEEKRKRRHLDVKENAGQDASIMQDEHLNKRIGSFLRNNLM